jgi:uncharacterized NAD(P)/FAD-binding protein YdhS
MKTIAIIGAGFSGTATAVRLLNQPTSEPLRVVLINRSGQMARGVAYGTQSPEHLLNVPAGNMSALAHDPDHFVRFCRSLDPAVASGDFVSRKIYGQYLAWLLDEAESRPAQHTSLVRIVGEVVGIGLGPGEAALTLADHRQLRVDRVVLAFGHFPPKNPEISDPRFYESSRYIRDPWSADAAARLAVAKRVLLLGTGLTAVDVCISLLNGLSERVIYAVSRRGLLPCTHRPSGPQPRSLDLSERMASTPATIRSYVHAIRSEAEVRSQQGEDWRNVLTAIRRTTPALWTRLPQSERARFLRHVQPYWEVHRHRAAPEPYERFQELILSRALRVIAGRVVRLQDRADRLHATVRLRGTEQLSELHVDTVVNCTGPSTDLSQVDDVLVRQLLLDGLVQPDPLKLGIEVSKDYAVRDARGIPSSVLYYVGPLLRARYWEATAVPELRVHAQRLADRLLSDLSVGVTPPAVEASID